MARRSGAAPAARKSGKRGAYQPRRGDLVYLDFMPNVGHEQDGRRPALVLSPRGYNTATGLMLACPVTSKIKGYPFEVPIPPGARLEGVILADHVRSLDWRARGAAYHGTADAATVEEVLARIEALLRIDPA